jgi:hypothetical protein
MIPELVKSSDTYTTALGKVRVCPIAHEDIS